MTTFLATPAETEAWLRAEVERLDLVRVDDDLPHLRMCFLWPRSAPPLAYGRGVQVRCPSATSSVLAAGETGWKASASGGDVAAVGRSLARALTRSLRRLATVPLFAMSIDGTVITGAARAWGTPAAVDSRLRLRQLPGAGCWYVPEGARPRATPAPPAEDRSCFEGDGSGRRSAG